MNSRGRKGRHSLLTHAQTEQALRRPSERSRRWRSGRGGRGRAPGRRGRRRQPRPSRRMDSPSEWGPWGRGLGRLSGGTGAAGGLWAERGGLGGEGEGGGEDEAAGRARGGARRSVENCVYKYSAEWKLAAAGREECGGAADRETAAVAEGEGFGDGGGGRWGRADGVAARRAGPSSSEKARETDFGPSEILGSENA